MTNPLRPKPVTFSLWPDGSLVLEIENSHPQQASLWFCRLALLLEQYQIQVGEKASWPRRLISGGVDY